MLAADAAAPPPGRVFASRGGPAARPQAPLLRIAHLTKKFGNATVVDDLSLEIMPGECLGLIGPNGAGKTTTIRVCLGLTGQAVKAACGCTGGRRRPARR